MKKLTFILIVLSVFGSNKLFAQNDSIERFVFLEYGFMVADEFSAVQFEIDKKWSIYRKPVAGCVVTDRLVDSVRIFNANTNDQLIEKHGADWKERYDQEISEAFKEHKIVLDQLKIDTIIREGQGFIERVINSPDYSMLSVEITPKEQIETEFTPITINNLQDDSNDIIYLGFSNLLEIKLSNSSASEFTIECVNCDINTIGLKDSLPAEHYSLRPKKRGESTINIYAENDLIISHTFEVQLLPDPEIHINNTPNGGELRIEQFDSTLIIEVRYQNNITLKSSFIVQHWELKTDKNFYLSGKGSEIKKALLKSLKPINAGSQLSIICTVKGPDGILRKKAAAFVLR